MNAKPDPELVPTSIRLPHGLLKRLRLAAVMDETSQQTIVIEALEQWLERNEKAAPKHARA
jgi:predicted transcriptional regulator